MASVITLAGQKGGAGKTTLAIHLAAELKKRGNRVLLVDTDPQGTAMSWAERAPEDTEGPTTIAMGDNVRAQLREMSKDYDYAFIDTPGRQSKRVAAALMVSDLVLLPCIPSPNDLWALADSLATVEQVQEVRELQAALVVNAVTKTGLTTAFKERLEEINVAVMSSELGFRVAFREAIAAGLGVTQYAPTSTAAAEVRSVVDELLGGNK